MALGAPPIYGNASLSVTCTRAHRDGLEVTVDYELKAQPPEPARQMRNQIIDASEHSYLRYTMYLDPGRTRNWGDGILYGSFVFTGTLFLDDRNRVGTLAHVVYGTVDGGQSLIAPGNWLGLVGVQLQYTAVCAGSRGVSNRGGVRGSR